MLGYLQADVSWRECFEVGEFERKDEFCLQLESNIKKIIRDKDLSDKVSQQEDYEGQFVDYVLHTLAWNGSLDDRTRLDLSQTLDYITFSLIMFSGVKAVF